MNELRLPARANLDHLRNEAKKLLKDLRRRSPDSKLAAAQLQVARSYGFASWRKLKSYIDALHDVGERLIQAVRTGDLDAMRSTLDRNPELVNATTDLEYRLRPSDTPACTSSTWLWRRTRWKPHDCSSSAAPT